MSAAAASSSWLFAWSAFAYASHAAALFGCSTVFFWSAESDVPEDELPLKKF